MIEGRAGYDQEDYVDRWEEGFLRSMIFACNSMDGMHTLAL